MKQAGEGAADAEQKQLMLRSEAPSPACFMSSTLIKFAKVSSMSRSASSGGCMLMTTSDCSVIAPRNAVAMPGTTAIARGAPITEQNNMQNNDHIHNNHVHLALPQSQYRKNAAHSQYLEPK